MTLKCYNCGAKYDVRPDTRARKIYLDKAKIIVGTLSKTGKKMSTDRIVYYCNNKDKCYLENKVYREGLQKDNDEESVYTEPPETSHVDIRHEHLNFAQAQIRPKQSYMFVQEVNLH